MNNRNPQQKSVAKKRGPQHSATVADAAHNEAMAQARQITSPTIRGAVTVQGFCKAYGELDLAALIEVLTIQNEQVQSGDLAHADKLLMTQANTLDVIFNELARHAACNMGQHLSIAERYLRLALKAQSQCRATLETLAAIKNPPVIYAKQANIAHGPQQVNNGSLPATAPAHGKTVTEQNELLEVRNGERLDIGTTSKTTSLNPAMATMEEIHRPANR